MSKLGKKIRVRAEDIAPGDFTTFTGYRRVLDVTPVLITRGRGKNKVELFTDVVLLRADGDSDRLPVSDNDDAITYTVYRQ